MDGFRERLGGRYDRGERPSSRGDRYDDRYEEGRYEDRYEERFERPVEDRFERSPRRESVSIDAIGKAIDASNREQLEVIMDLFDEAKADRLDSAKAIVGAVSDILAEEMKAAPARNQEEAVEEEKVQETQAQADLEVLSRIERMTSQNAEAISESSEMLERSVNSLRSNTELLNDIRGSIASLEAASSDIREANQAMQQNIQQSLYEVVNQQNQSPVSYEETSSVGTDEILSAVGDNRTLLNMIRQDIITRFDKPEEESLEEEKPKEAYLTADAAANYYKELEDHVHKECVKCYRNVQSTLQDQNAEAIGKTEKSVAGVHTLAVVSIALNVVTIALLVCNILGII